MPGQDGHTGPPRLQQPAASRPPTAPRHQARPQQPASPQPGPPYDVDVAVLLRPRGAAGPCAAIDRDLVDLLLAVRDEGSVAAACLKLSCSTRHAQRILKRFRDASGIALVRPRGRRGAGLTDQAARCIDLYAAARDHAARLAAANRLGRQQNDREG